MDFFGQVEKAAGIAALGGKGGVGLLAVHDGTAAEGTIDDGNARLLTGLLRNLEGSGQARTLGSGEIRDELGPVPA